MTAPKSGKLSMGPGTLDVAVELFALNRSRLVGRLRADDNVVNAMVVLQGGADKPLYDTDVDYLFKQESYFMWAFGVLEPGCFGAIHTDTGRSYLFVPRLPDSYAIWMGPLHTLAEFQLKYNTDEVHYVDELKDVLLAANPGYLLVLDGLNTDSNLTHDETTFPGIELFNVNKILLYPQMADLRVFKTDLEMQVMRYVIAKSCEAHRKVMRMARPGVSEYQCEAEFLHHTYSVGGCRNVSYTCICGSGDNSAILHYGHAGAPNDRFVVDGDMCLFDMGANYFGYAADVTCTFPANGVFTPDQKLIYEAVLTANLAIHAAAKPGVKWADMHLLANRVLLQQLVNGGLLVGDVDAMVTAGLGYTFQPHGLGHLLGLDVHDVGGYLKKDPTRPVQPKGAELLRTARVLQAGMVLTIEPGCYFIDPLLDAALVDPVLSPFLVPTVIQRFRGAGGVRIEDDVLITDTGVENLTDVPRTVVDIEAWISGKGDSKRNTV